MYLNIWGARTIYVIRGCQNHNLRVDWKMGVPEQVLAIGFDYSFLQPNKPIVCIG